MSKAIPDRMWREEIAVGIVSNVPSLILVVFLYIAVAEAQIIFITLFIWKVK